MKVLKYQPGLQAEQFRVFLSGQRAHLSTLQATTFFALDLLLDFFLELLLGHKAMEQITRRIMNFMASLEEVGCFLFIV